MNLRTIITVLTLLSLLLSGTAGYLYYRSAKTSALEAAEREIVSKTETVRDHILRLIDANKKEAKVLAGFEELKYALQKPGVETLANANRVLDHFTRGLEYDVCYLMDREGNTIASSNRDQPDSFVGVNYGFRPYFQEAIQGVPSIYFALGITSQVRGVYLGHPVHASREERPLGVVVVKTSVEFLERDLSPVNGDVAFLADDNGMIFLSSRKEWLFHLLWKLSPEAVSRIIASRQFGKGPFHWSGLEKQECNRVIGKLGEEYLINQIPIDNCPGWKVVYLSSLPALYKRIIEPMTAIAGYVALILCILVAASVLVLYRQGHREIVGRKEAEEALKQAQRELWSTNAELRESEHRIRTITDSLPACIAYIDPEQRYRFANKTYERWFRVPQEEMPGKHVSQVVGPEIYPKVRGFLEKALTGANVSCELTVPGNDHDVRWRSMVLVPDLDAQGSVRGCFVLVHDITDLKQIQISLEKTGESLEASLKEKESLLREVHHRVKNNLAVVVGLLTLQSERMENVEAKEIFADIEARVRSMALAHEMLYQSGNLAEVNMSEFIDALVDHLSFSFGTVGKSIAIRKDIQDATMELETAVPVGFIVTELVSNCLKHAFPDRTQGEIRIALHRCNDDQFELTVSDNGVGIPQRVDFANPRSMGLDLVSVFARQLEGEIQVNRESGTEIQVKFRNIGGRQCNFSKSPG